MNLIPTTLSSTLLKSCILNASGPLCTTYDELSILLDNDYIGAVVTKSCTLAYRQGNEHPRYYSLNDRSINSTGLANQGYRYYIDFVRSVHANKPCIISVAGLTQDDNMKILSDIEDSSLENFFVELNLSCPNIKGKSQLAYNFEETEEFLRRVFDKVDMNIGLKLPPYFDIQHFETMATIIRQFPKVKFITCINSLGNGLIINKDTAAIKPNNGYGGVGGSIIKPFALSNVRHFYDLLQDRVDIVGCGGISTGTDAYEHILCGATAVQIGTQFMNEGISCFERISRELKNIIQDKSIDDIKGRLKMI